MNPVNKSVGATLTKASGGSFILSSTDLDLDRDRMTLPALKGAVEKMTKLITLWQHKQDQPIGFWENIRLEGKKIIGDLVLASTNLSLMVKQLLDDDVPLGASIGFMGKGEWNDDGGIDFTEMNLLECSVVSVPANPAAQRIAKTFGFDPSSLVEVISPDAGHSDAVKTAIRNARRATVRANKMMGNT